MKLDYALLAKLGKAVLEEVSDADMTELEQRTRDKYLELIAVNAANLLVQQQLNHRAIMYTAPASEVPPNLRGVK